MSLTGLVELLATDQTLSGAIVDASSQSTPALDLAVPAPLRPLVAAALARGSERPVLLVASTYREAENLTSALQSVMSPDEVAYYPAWETLPHERLSPQSDTVGKRLAVLRRLCRTDGQTPPRVLVAPVRGLLQPQVKGLGRLVPVRLSVGSDYDIEKLATDLVQAAYLRVDLVERRGEFAIRGGIVDLFPPNEQHPVRIDFFGDTVEDIRAFGVADQRSTGTVLKTVLAPPCREMLLTEEVKTNAAALVSDHPELTDLLERVAAGHAVEGMESLAPALLNDDLELLTDVLDADTLVVLSDPELVRGRAHDLVKMSEEFLQASWAGAAGGGKAPIDLGATGYRALAEVRSAAMKRGMSWWSMSSFQASPDDADSPRTPVRTETGEIIDLSGVGQAGLAPRTVTLPARAAKNWHGNTEEAAADISQAVSGGWTVVLTAEGHGLLARMAEVLGEADVAVRMAEDLTTKPEPGIVHIAPSGLLHGFALDSIKLALFSAGDLSGQQSADKSQRTMPARRKKQINPLELTAGDAVVHESHGVGRYIDMVQRTVQSATREYLVIEYAPSKRGQPGDRLYVPMDQLDLVTRYVGGEAPSLDKMGGADWNKRKGRARKAVRQIAGELIKLYAARRASQGYAFGPDTPWQLELEDAFGYVETPDQLAAIEDVKADMEQIVPMDRLICGDVGYGKTEIAVRAAFKAVQDGKQVAVLVPTTLLVQQHQATFSERYAGFPVVVSPLSRFQTAAQTTATKAGVKAGSVDVVVGTHRLLAGEVEFKDLGLVIIDEEQRFGVEHKETLKRLRTHVDVLAMSATPIPRTLEMAITGIREMSTIATPPEERHPVLTFAGPFDYGQAAAAIRRELMREGQVFFIHNRVQSIDKTAAKLRDLVPEARVVTAHGQMNEHQLEQVMVDFWERRADVLVCTTIVEAGLDIASANTLLIERSDLLGLSQLHQLRGRVGRGRERGYAYFLYPPDKPLTETAHDRLATMAANTDLGSGMAIAMKDLEIRGAGNMLGGEQSGHIADVGFDLYIRLVGEAVAEYRGEDVEPEPEVRIELPVDAHLPVTYVESERLRLEMYKRLAEVRTKEDIDSVLAELTDRYGEPGTATLTLLEVARFRIAARAAGLTEVVSQGNHIRFGPSADLPESRHMRLQRLYPGSIVKQTAGFILVPRPRNAMVGAPLPVDRELLQWCEKVVADIFAA